MKKFVVLIFLIGMIGIINAQSLNGRWQEKTSKVSSGYLGNYQFSEDGTFSYNTNEYFGLGRVKSIEGYYSFNNKTNVLSLTVVFIDELFGGSIEKSKEAGEATGSWNITGGEVRKTKLIKPIKAIISVEFKKSDSTDAQLVLFDKMKYYKVE